MNIRFLSIISLLLISFINSEAQKIWRIEFGNESHDQTIQIKKPAIYNEETGFGFDFENTDAVRIINSDSSDYGFCTSDLPFYFSVRIPEGTYEVIVTFGNPESASETTIKSEARRLMVQNAKLEKGKTRTDSFTISVRSPKIDDARTISLKPREVNYMNWDDRLSLEFSGKHPAIQKIEIQPKSNYTTLFFAGNSTVTDQDCAPWASWGQMITAYFDPTISVANYAESGEALASFKGEGRLEKVLTMMKPGDYLFIEFGHNDQKRKGEGIGPWTSFTDLLIEYVTLSREKGGIPVLITPTQRRSFNDAGLFTPTHGDYPTAMKKVAEELDVPLIDLNTMTKKMYEAWGPEDSKKAFVHYPALTFPEQEKELKDNTHFNTFGAHEIALCVLQGIIENNIGIENHIRNFNYPYNPEKPSEYSNWELIMSPRFVSKKPDGN